MESKINKIVGTNDNPVQLESGQVIINKKSTKKHIKKLVEINEDGDSNVSKNKTTTDGTDGGILKGKPHYDKNGNPTGGIPAKVDGERTIEVEGDEFVVNKEASEKHWKELSKINTDGGNGVPINKPSHFDDDPEEYKKGGKIIEFNPNHIPPSHIIKYALKIKNNHPEIWKLGGNIFGNEAFENLYRAYKRGYWLDSEKWMYIKWRSYVARHQRDFRIEGVIAMLKWTDKVGRGWSYMKQLIESEIKKKANKSGWKTKKNIRMSEGGNTEQYKTIAFFTNKKFKIFDGKKTFSEIKKSFGITPLKLDTIKLKTKDLTNNELFIKWSENELLNKYNEVLYPSNLYFSIIKEGENNIVKNAFWENELTGEKYEYDAENIAWVKDNKNYKEGGTTKSEWIIDGKEATQEDFIEIYQRQQTNIINGGFDFNPKKVEYLGDNESSIRAVKDYNRIASIYDRNGEFKQVYMKAIIGKALNETPFVKFGNAFRKHIDSSFKAKNRKLNKSSWRELASYVIGDIDYNISENNFRSFAKELGIDLPKNENINPDIRFREGGVVMKKGGNVLDKVVWTIKGAKDEFLTASELFKIDKKEYWRKRYLPKLDKNVIAKSKLNIDEWKLVNSKNFIQWFGDWNKFYSNSSLVTNSLLYEDNDKGFYYSEPLKVYHASNTADYYEFNLDNKKTDSGFFGNGFYFGTSLSQVMEYGYIIRKYFVNLRNPFYFEGSEREFAIKLNLSHLLKYDKEYDKYYLTNEFSEAVTKYLISEKYDGLIIDSTFGSEIIAFYPEQIKLADGTNTTFDGSNPDIRFDEGGVVTYRNKYNKKYGYDLDESHDLNEIAKDTGVSKKGLQEIYNKGIGAYKTNPESVRPNVKSKEQWAMGRVYSAVMGGKASKVDSNELKMENGGKINDEELELRWNKKKNAIQQLANNIQKLRYNVTKDLSSENEKDFLTALVISIIDKTGERVGNEESATNGHFGVTGFKKKHISINGNKVTLKYIGKSGVEHETTFSDEKIANALKKAILKSTSDFIFNSSDGFQIKANKINRYLSLYNVSAKDLRGYSANNWIIEKLNNINPEKEPAKRKKQFNKILNSVAEKIGHGKATLKKHYLVPELETNFIENGKIINIKQIGGNLYHLGGNMSKHLAPNGNPSNLTHEQWHLVRTPEFKAWFGDWENDPKNASKVVDENGEPLVVYHGGGDFNYFNAEKIGTTTDKGWYGYGFYFSPSQEISNLYGGSKAFFIKIKKIFNCNKDNPFYGATKEVTEYYIEQGYDGSSKTFDVNKRNHEYCVFFKFPNNIKLADGTNTTFDANNPDIRFDEGGEVEKLKKSDYKSIIAEKQQEKANELRKKLIAEGFKGISTPYSSKTDFGVSTYFIFYDDFNIMRKFRISDHSVTNIDRIWNEYHYTENTDLNALVDRVKSDINKAKQDNLERNKLWEADKERTNLADKKWDEIKPYFVGLTFKHNDRTYQNLEEFSKNKNRSNIYQKSLGTNKYGEEAFYYEWTEPIRPNEMPKLKPSREYIEQYKNITYKEGGNLYTNCIDYIKNSEAIKNNGYYTEFKNLDVYVGAEDKIVPKDVKNLFLITYNSSGQKNLKAIDTINSKELAYELAKLLKIEIGIAKIIVSEQAIYSKRFDIKLINSIIDKNIVIADRDKIVCENISDIRFEEGGGVDNEIVFVINDYETKKFTTNEPIWFEHSDGDGTEALLLEKTKSGKAKIKILLDYKPYTRLIESNKYVSKKSFTKSGEKETIKEGTIKVVSAERIGKIKDYMPRNHNPYSKEFINYLSYISNNDSNPDRFDGGGEVEKHIERFIVKPKIKFGLIFGYVVYDTIEKINLPYEFDEDEKFKAQSRADLSNALYESKKMVEGGGVGESTSWEKMALASSRFKPVETIFFNPPLIGNNGAKLVSYTWAYEMTMQPNWEGELVGKRVSDWTQAEISAETGRGIVHQYTIQLTDGTFKTVSSESVPILMGYVDRTQAKVFGNLATASKTLAKQQMKLSILEAQKKEYDELYSKFEKAPKPEITLAEISDLPFITQKIYQRQVEEGKGVSFTSFKMGDIIYKQDNNYNYNEGKYIQSTRPNNRTIEQLTSMWISERVKEAGGINPRELYDLKNRVERQKRKVEQMLKTPNMEDGGNVEDEKKKIKLQILKLTNKSFKMFPSSPSQKKVIEEINELRERLDKLDGKFADGGTTDDFDYMSLFNTSAEYKEKINQEIKKSQEQEKEDWYQSTNFSKKWASTYQDAINKTVKEYLDAKATYEDWGSRQYKENKGMVFLGGDDIFGQSKSIGSINEGRRRNVLKGAKMQMDEAIETLKELKLSDEEISNLLENKLAKGGGIEVKSGITESHEDLESRIYKEQFGI